MEAGRTHPVDDKHRGEEEDGKDLEAPEPADGWRP